VRWGSRTGEEQGISGRGACRRRESSFRRAARRNRRCTGPTSRRAFQFDAKSAGFPVPAPERKHGVRPAGPRCSKRNAKNGLQFALPALSSPQCGQSQPPAPEHSYTHASMAVGARAADAFSHRTLGCGLVVKK
jgi:hypothetical protein